MNCYLEKLIAKTKNSEFLNNIDILGNIEKIGFKWNNPVSEIDIFSFEKENNIIIPKDYKEFLLLCDGGIIYEDEYGDGGYELLGIHNILNETKYIYDLGYNIDNSKLLFFKSLYTEDYLMFDSVNKNILGINLLSLL